MLKLLRFWKALEALPGLSALRTEWVKLVGDEWEFAQQFLRPATDLSSSYPCPASIPCGCIHGVAQIGGEEYLAYCRCESKRCPDTPLTRSDLLVHELDWRKLCEGISTALELSPGYLPVDDVPHAATIGRYNPASGEYFHVILLIAGDANEFQDRVERIALRFRARFILLSPTRAYLTPSAEATLRECKSIMFALDEILASDYSDRIVCVQLPSALLIEFGRRHVPSLNIKVADDRPYVEPDTNWGQIEISFRNGLDVRILIRGKPHDTDLKRMELVRKESGNWVANEQGKLLRKFVDGSCYVYTTSTSRATTKKQCQRLSAALKDYLSIPGDPISPLDDHTGWRANFRVKPSD